MFPSLADRWNVFTLASRGEVAAEVDQLLDTFPDRFEHVGVFAYVLVTLPWDMGFKHGRIHYSRLSEALAKLQCKERA